MSEHDELAVSCIPCDAPERLAWLAAFQRGVEGDAAATRVAMVAQGWEDGQARDAYVDWLDRVVAAAVDAGWPA